MKITLTKIFTTDKDKEGKPLVNRNGKEYTRMSIKTQEHGDSWLSGFLNNTNANWKEGDTVEVEVEKAGDKGQYLNFKTISGYQLLEQRIEKLEEDVKRLAGSNIGETEIPVIEDDASVKEEDLPF